MVSEDFQLQDWPVCSVEAPGVEYCHPLVLHASWQKALTNLEHGNITSV